MSKHPLNEGSIGEIFRRYFKPLVRFKSETSNLSEFLAELFGAKTREIDRFIVTKPFQMPGLMCVAPLTKVQGIGFRKVKRNSVLYVRTDLDTPDVVTIQWLRAGRDQTFELNASEWHFVQLHLRGRAE